ncbi:MAG: hypothetical protein ABI833_07030 [Acidobacteriota bacterium]
MATLETTSAETKERVERIGEADLVVALPSCHNRELLEAAVSSLRAVVPELSSNGKVVILYPESANVDMPGDDESSLLLLPCALSPVERYHEPSLAQGLRSLLTVGRALRARACVMLGSEAAVSIPDGLRLLAEPVLKHGYDLAVPLYARRKLDSLINSGIAYPLTRALYGARLCYPMAADLALSQRLADQYLRPSALAGQPQSGWATTKAVCAGLQVCQVHRDFAPVPIVSEQTDLSSSLAQVLSTLFMDVEQNAGFWQRTRGSQPVRTFGQPRQVDFENPAMDVHKMVETFQRGCRDLLDVWAVTLSPATLIDLKKAAKLPVDRFRLMDDLWVHVLFDFILGHRQRVISREHLLRSMTPIYLGWVASYALEVQNLGQGAVEDRLEKLCLSFETLKPYLLSRWRWPDRFNP